MPLRVTKRPDRSGHWIEGRIKGYPERVRQRARSDSLRLAQEEAAALEAQILRTLWHGERRGTRSFAEAVLSYLDAEPRSANHRKRLNRLLTALGDITLAAIDQDKANQLKRKMLRPDASPGAYRDAIVMPLRAVLNYAHELGWCDPPRIKRPRDNPGRTLFLLPHQAERLIAFAAAHLQALLIFLICTGARMSEAIELDWQDVDLVGARAILSRTKGKAGGKRRDLELSPRAVVALANLPRREGPVFLTDEGVPYADRERRYGGQIKTAWAGAVRRAGLNPELNPHDLRHTWASWQYALHKDLIRLQLDGRWSSITLVTRYAHLMPAGQEAAIRQFLGFGPQVDPSTKPATASGG